MFLTNSSDAEPAGRATLPRLHIPKAGPGWRLIMQSGAEIHCQVGIALTELLQKELAFTPEQLQPVEAFLLNGMPVDVPEESIVPDNARLALAAGLPGIAGLSMKKGSAVRALRSGITYREKTAPNPHPGTVHLMLYSLVLPLLAEHVLQRGIIVSAKQLLTYSRFSPHDLCFMDGKEIPSSCLASLLPTLLKASQILLSIGRIMS